MTRRIGKDELVAGYSAKSVRSLMRRLEPLEVFGAAYAFEQAQALSTTPAKACADLVRAGYLASASDRDREVALRALGVVYGKPPYMMITGSGMALARAVAYAPLSRASADRVVGELLGRIQVVNAVGAQYAYRVKRLEAFGSYVGEAPTVNDLDLFLSLEPASNDGHRDRRHERIREAEAAGRRFRNLGARYSWPRTEVLQFLRAHSPYLRFHGEEDRAVVSGRRLRLWPLSKRGPQLIHPSPSQARRPVFTAPHIAALAAVAVGEHPGYFAPHRRSVRTLEDRGLIWRPDGAWRYQLTRRGKAVVVATHAAGKVKQAIATCSTEANRRVGVAVLAKLGPALR